MKKFAKIFHLSVAGVLLFFNSERLLAQSPYSLSNEWRFGNNAGLGFPTGDYPNSGAPSVTPSASNPNANNPEASTSLSDTSGAVALYTDLVSVRNVTNGIIRGLVGDHACAGSSTGGGVAIPDPISPSDTYYLFIANDLTNNPGACFGNGIQYYKFKKNGSGQATYVSGPTNLVAGNWADESISACTDGQGNYYLVAHTYNSNTFRIFKIDNTGVNLVNGDQSKTPAFSIFNGTQSYSKISPCQNMIAWFGGGNLVVYDFDRASGRIGNIKLSKSGLGFGVGLEFSPDGKYIYISGQGSIVNYYNISNGATGSIAGSGSWSMQMGPDGKIYTSPGGGSIGVINDPNNPASTSYGSIPLGSGSTFRGLVNVAWLNPNKLKLDNTINSCKVDYTYQFKNYYNTNIAIDPNTLTWDFGDNSTSTSANPSHTYAANGTYKVKLQFNDATCGHNWIDSIDVTVSCGVTPPTCNLNASVASITSPVNVDDVNTTTVKLDGSASTFNGTGTAQYYWMNGSADTNTVFARTATTDVNFAFNGTSPNLPEGSYDFYLVIRQGTCMDTSTVHIDVVHPPCSLNSSIGTIASPVEVINNDTTTVTFDATASTFGGIGTKQYYWMNGSADTNTVFDRSDKPSLEFAYNATGNVLPEGSYDFYLVIRQGNCTDTSKVHIDVNHVLKCTYNINADLSPTNISNIYLDGSGPKTINFDGSTSVFDAKGTEPTQYYWMVGSADTSTALSKTSTYDMTFDHNGAVGTFPEGTYDVYLVIREGLCLDTVKTAQFKTYYFPPGSCRYDIDAKIDNVRNVMVDEHNNATATFSGLPSVFDPSGTEPRLYYWMNGVADTNTAFAKTPTSSLNFAYHGAGGMLPEGRYEIYLIIREGYCTDTARVQLDVTRFFIPTLITPNGDSHNETFDITNTPGRYNLEVFNRWGKTVYQEKGYTNGWPLDKVSDGVYYYHVEDTESNKNFKGWVQILRGNNQ